MPDSLATLDDLKNRLDFTLDADEERVATAALEDSSEEARHHGRSTWVNPATSPPYVKTLVLRACKRHMENINGYEQSRAGDETIVFPDKDPHMGVVHFTEDEIEQIKRLAGKVVSDFGSMQIIAWGTKLPAGTGYRPVDAEGKPFPMFNDDDEPLL